MFEGGNLLLAQNQENKTDDFGRIALHAYVPEQAENISPSVERILINKMSQIATRNGLGANSFNPRFIIVPNITVLSKDITSTAPPMVAMNIEVTFYVGDGVDGKLFSSASLELKGVGTNETKAYISAIKQIKPTNARLKRMIKEGKTKIIEYYNSHCDFILKKAQTLADAKQYDAAIYTLVTVPEVCKDCYMKSLDMVGPLYQKAIDYKCEILLSEAKNVWSAGLDVDAAKKAAQYLSEIDPNSKCFEAAKELTKEMKSRVKELDEREWNLILKMQQDNVDIQKSAIEAAREIGIAYAKNQPQNVVYKNYNIEGWW
jgi:hypothetical protein